MHISSDVAPAAITQSLNGIIDEAKNNETIINSMFETIKAESGIELELYRFKQVVEKMSFKTVKNIGLNKPFIKGSLVQPDNVREVFVDINPMLPGEEPVDFYFYTTT